MWLRQLLLGSGTRSKAQDSQSAKKWPWKECAECGCPLQGGRCLAVGQFSPRGMTVLLRAAAGISLITNASCGFHPLAVTSATSWRIHGYWGGPLSLVYYYLAQGRGTYLWDVILQFCGDIFVGVLPGDIQRRGGISCR